VVSRRAYGIKDGDNRIITKQTKPKWSIDRLKGNNSNKDYWCHIWTPRWHKGRGVYVTIGLGWLAIYRGY